MKIIFKNIKVKKYKYHYVIGMSLQKLMRIPLYKYWSKMYYLKVGGEYFVKHQVNAFYAKFISTKPVTNEHNINHGRLLLKYSCT